MGQELTKQLLKLYPDVKLITTDMTLPPAFVEDENRLKRVKADLGNKEEMEGLFEGEEVGGVFALQWVSLSLST